MSSTFSDTQQLVVPDVQNAPLDYTVPSTQEIELLAVSAVYDGTAASGSYLPTLEIFSDSGHLVARVPCSTTITAGSGAEATWAPFLRVPAAAPAPSAYQDPYLFKLFDWARLRGETYWFPSGGTAQPLVAGTVYYMAVGLASGLTFTNANRAPFFAYQTNTTAGTPGQTLNFALYNRNPALVWHTTDNGAFGSAGFVDAGYASVSPATFTTTYTGLYYIAILWTDAGAHTAPQFLCGNTFADATTALTPFETHPMYALQTGRASFPSFPTFATSALAFWAGIAF